MEPISRLCVLPEGGIGFREIETPPLSDQSVRVRTYYTGIRHADTAYCNGSVNTNHADSLEQCVWGVGEVIETGNSVQKVAKGQWVTSAMHHQPVQTIPESLLYPLDELKRVSTVFVDPAITALHCVRTAGIRFGDAVAVFGAGAVGLMAIQYCRLSGARWIVMVDPVPERRKIAQRLGAYPCVAHAGQIVDSCQINDIDVPGSFHAAIEMSGSSDALPESVHIVRPNGVLAVCGTTYTKEAIANVQRLCKEKEVRLLFSNEPEPSRELAETALYSLKSKRAIAWPIPVTYFPFDEAPNAYQEIHQRPGEFIKSVFYYEER